MVPGVYYRTQNFDILELGNISKLMRLSTVAHHSLPLKDFDRSLGL